MYAELDVPVSTDRSTRSDATFQPSSSLFVFLADCDVRDQTTRRNARVFGFVVRKQNCFRFRITEMVRATDMWSSFLSGEKLYINKYINI